MIFNRQLLEKIEEQSLAPYGMQSKNSKGREHPDHEPAYRTTYQRDRDRIIHTTSFRRLEYKTQVFINYEGDYFRTRLTHTLEVAQIGQSIGKALGANLDLVEAVCLAHDLGHPPFGHSGERMLNSLMKDYGGFDHNKHSMRIVTKLEKRYRDFPGLNLSWEVREGIVKHETEYDISDAKDFNPDLRGLLEAQIANVADELAYSAHDLDDGLRSGMITPDILSGVEFWEILIEQIGWVGPVLTDIDRHVLIRKLIGILVTDAVTTISSKIQGANVKTPLDIQKLEYNVIGYSDPVQRRHRELKTFLYKNLYRHNRVMRMQKKSERIIEQLFNEYRNEPAMLPKYYQATIDKLGLERTICYYLAGMTDRYAIQEHKKLFDPLTLP